MTKDDLLKMAPGDYMNDLQLSFFKDLLVGQRAEVLGSLQECRDALGSFEKPADVADLATVEEARLDVSRTIERLNSRQRSIDLALSAIDDGEYGYCLDLGTEIGLPRLLNQPTALLSFEAQTDREMKDRHKAA